MAQDRAAGLRVVGWMIVYPVAGWEKVAVGWKTAVGWEVAVGWEATEGVD